jgi:glycerophosphoryl diester phosphodiesterase
VENQKSLASLASLAEPETHHRSSSFMHQLEQQKRFQQPLIIAHRGYRAKYPENTLCAFEAALDAGAAMIELDVSLSYDRRVVVIHDTTLQRTTNGYGPVNGFTLKELKQLDAGSWFNSDFAGERIPELIEVMELVDGRALINIEIKSNAYEPYHPLDAIERQVMELVRQKKAQDYILISSFNIFILEQLVTQKDAPPLAWISKCAADHHTVEMCTRINAFSWHPEHLILTKEQVKMIHAAGIRVFPFNMETRADFDRMLLMGVDGAIINDPVEALEWLS